MCFRASKKVKEFLRLENSEKLGAKVQLVMVSGRSQMDLLVFLLVSTSLN